MSALIPLTQERRSHVVRVLLNRPIAPLCRVLTCVYCGHAYPQDTPAHGHEILTAHIASCAKHPMRGYIELLTEAKARLEEAQLIGQMSHRFQAWVHAGVTPMQQHVDDNRKEQRA